MVLGAVRIQTFSSQADRGENTINGGQQNGQNADRNQYLNQGKALF
jgi:hypothetical protein